MKKLVLSVALCLALTLSACGTPAPAPATQPPSAGTSAESTAATEMKKTFGTFTLPQGWSESPEFSKGSFYTYFKDGTDLENAAGNISISYGTSRYGKDEETEFAQAVDLLIKSQVDSETVIRADESSTTKQNLPLIIRTLEDKEALTVQYYIMGERQHIIVQAVDFYDEQIADLQQAALDMVDSFVWADKAE